MTEPGPDPELAPREDVIASWRAKGFTTDLEVAEGGMIVTTEDGRRFQPEDVVVEEIHRYEGATNPGDEELLLALTANGAEGSVKGTLTLAYGAYASADEAEAARRLPARDR